MSSRMQLQGGLILKRAFTTSDGYNVPRPSAAGQIKTSYHLEPRPALEDERDRQTSVQEWLLILPRTAIDENGASRLAATDQFRDRDGAVYDVVGVPQVFTAAGGRMDHVEATLRVTSG